MERARIAPGKTGAQRRRQGAGTPARGTGPSEPGAQLLALQQTAGNRAVRRLVRGAVPAAKTGAVRRKGAGAAASGRAQFLRADWIDVNELGLAYKQGSRHEGGGVNLREQPGGRLIRWLEPNTKVYVLEYNPRQKAYAVTTVGARGGEFGYVASWLVWRHLPDPEADVVKIKPGQAPIDVAREHYAGKGFNVWGMDLRYVVNALVWVNNHARHNAPGEPGIKKPGKLSGGWMTAETTAGVYIWLPGPEHLKAIYETVAEHGGGTGSITADLWRQVKQFGWKVAYGLSFVGGMVHGFFKSLYDAVVGLAEMVVDVLGSIFTGSVVRDAEELWEAVSKLTWSDVKDAVGDWALKWSRKLESKSPWTAGHAHGYLTGYVMAEAAMLLLTGGTLAAAKAALWTTRFGKVIKASRAYGALARGIEKARRVGSGTKEVLARAGSALRRSRPFTSLRVARAWAAKTLALPARIARGLPLAGINRLRQLPDDVLAKFRRLSTALKRRALGCASPCKVEIDAVRDAIAHGGWFTRKAWRRRLHRARWTRHGGKHLRATSADEARRISRTGASQYLPGIDNRSLEMTALRRGQVTRDAQGTVHVYYKFDRVVGYSEGRPTKWIRAEITSGDVFHGHPRSLRLVRRAIPDAAE